MWHSELVADRYAQNPWASRSLRYDELSCRGEEAHVAIGQVLAEELHVPLILREPYRGIDEAVCGVLEAQECRVARAVGGQGGIVAGLREGGRRVVAARLREHIVVAECPVVAQPNTSLEEGRVGGRTADRAEWIGDRDDGLAEFRGAQRVGQQLRVVGDQCRRVGLCALVVGRGRRR